MPTTIPYDPVLVLGNLVDQSALDQLTQISTLQAPVDGAEEVMNSFISMKRSLDMTIQELIDMNIDTRDLIKESEDVGKNIQASAVAYAKAKLEAEKKIQVIKARALVNSSEESPIDYNRTQIKKMPLSADSMKMNVQYFSFDENTQTSQTQAMAIKSFISGQVDDLGDKVSAQASAAAQSQVNSQYSRHSISGTLVIAVTCTHKDAVLLAPFVLDVDKAIRVWNKVHNDDLIKTDSLAAMDEIAKRAETSGEKSLTILSGATYGSCFIGMVHVLNTSSTEASEEMYSVASSLQTQFEIGSWFADVSGGFGVDSSFSDDAKNLLSRQEISSHCTLTTMGSIPSIKSNQVKMGVKEFADFDGAKAMENLAKLQNATGAEKKTVGEAASAARTGKQMIIMENAKVESTLSALGDIDDGQNKILDINSMMDALDDYIQKALQGNIGVPINYYLKPITKSELAQMWVAKYFPGRYLTVTSGDDTGSRPNATGGGGSTTSAGTSDTSGGSDSTADTASTGTS